MALYTGTILAKSMYPYGRQLPLKTYQDIGDAAFGKGGYYFTLFIQNAALVSVGILFMILAGLNLQQLAIDWDIAPSTDLDIVKVCIAGVVVVVFPFIIFLKTMTEISFIAIFGMFATTFTVFVVIIFSFIDEYHGKAGGGSHTWINADSIPFAFSSLVFAFGGHNVFPAIEQTMRRRSHFNKMIIQAFVIILALYVPPCVVGYYIYGENAKEVILDNLVQGIVPQIARIAITLHLIITLPIVNNPINLWLEDLFKIEDSAYEFPKRALIRTALLFAQGAVAILVPHFFDVMAFIGASCVSGTVFFFPCIAYLQLFWKKISNLEIIWICLVLMTASLGSVIGLYSAVVGIAQDVGNVVLDVPKSVFPYGLSTGTFLISFLGIGATLWWISRSHNRADYARLNSNSPE